VAAGLAIGTWVAGFDILYACQDLDFDRAHGLRSIPVRFGVGRALAISRATHVVTVACLALLGFVADLGWVYLAGVAGVAALLVFEQSLVSEHDLSQVKRAFDLNGYVGILYFVTWRPSMCAEPAERRRSFTIAITGASGALYATRTMAALLERGCHLELIISDYGRRLLRDELGEGAAVDKLPDFLASKYGEPVRRGTYTLHSNKDLGAKVASGSQNCEGMVVVPCSMKSLAGIHRLSRNLVERAADVMLKERRAIVVPRETPMSLPSRNMVLCAEAGAMILPAMPAFYQMPRP
jgi:polyprenyl P-hydroxybenzoate/phenylacrylic acid decarboxylase-like protein